MSPPAQRTGVPKVTGARGHMGKSTGSGILCCQLLCLLGLSDLLAGNSSILRSPSFGLIPVLEAQKPICGFPYIGNTFVEFHLE